MSKQHELGPYSDGENEGHVKWCWISALKQVYLLNYLFKCMYVYLKYQRDGFGMKFSQHNMYWASLTSAFETWVTQ